MPEKKHTQVPQKKSTKKKPPIAHEAIPQHSDAEYLSASPAMVGMVAGDLPQVELQRHLQAMNKVAGNRATAFQVMRSRQPSAAAVQRDGDQPTGTWNMPLELGPVSDKAAARTAIGLIIGDMNTLLEELGGQSPVDNPIPALQEKQAALGGSGLLTQAEANDLNTLTSRVQVAHDLMIMQIQQAVATGMSQLSTMPDASSAEVQLSDALAKTSHKAFTSGEGEDKIGALKDALSKVQEYNKKCGEVADYARKAASAVKLVKTVSALKAFKSASGNLGTALDKVISVADTASQIATVAGFNKEKAGSMDQSINQLRAGVALAGSAMSLFKGVPLIGAYWSNYVVPMTDACLRGLEGLTDIGITLQSEDAIAAFEARRPTYMPSTTAVM